jgi:hypothetical protein
MDKKIPLVIKNTMVKDNPFFVDNRHHVGRLMMLFYPLFEKLFEKTYRLGYFFERVVFENNYRRLLFTLIMCQLEKINSISHVDYKDRETVKEVLIHYSIKQVAKRSYHYRCFSVR